jgi:hypothetical protein
MRCSIASLLDDLISASEQRVWHVDPQRLSRLEIDDQFKFSSVDKTECPAVLCPRECQRFRGSPRAPMRVLQWIQRRSGHRTHLIRVQNTGASLWEIVRGPWGRRGDVISGMLNAQIQTLRPFCYNLDGPFWIAVCVKLLSKQRGYRDKTLNGR